MDIKSMNQKWWRRKRAGIRFSFTVLNSHFLGAVLIFVGAVPKPNFRNAAKLLTVFSPRFTPNR